MKYLVISIFFAFIIFSSKIFAQDSIADLRLKPEKSFLRNDRPWTIELPIWIPGYRGDFTYGDISLEGEDGSSPVQPIEPEEPLPPWGDGNIFSRVFNNDGKLNFFFLSRVAYQKKNFLGSLDAFSGSVGASLIFRYNNKELVQANFRTTLIRLYAGYKFYNFNAANEKINYKLYGFGGIRWHGADINSDLNDIINRINISPWWAEPILGVRNELVLHNWMIVAQVDMGGFNINNKASYMINLYAYYKFSKLLSGKFGWCDWDIYSKGLVRDENLVLNVHLSGPAAALTFHF